MHFGRDFPARILYHKNAMPQLIFRSPEGETFAYVLDGTVITVGRSSENTVQIHHPTVSRRHAQLVLEQRGAESVWSVADLQSANGTRLNGTSVTAPIPLHDSDRLEFGTVQADYRESLAPAFCPIPEPAITTVPGELPKKRGAYPAEGADASALSVGLVLDNTYRLEEFLGEGPGFQSFQAQELGQRRPISIKFIEPAALAAPGAFERLRHMIECLQAHPHPNLVRTLELRQAHGWTFVASEWIIAISLLDVLRHRQELAPREALMILGQVAAAIDHCTEHGLPQPDLNPRPLLLSFTPPPLDQAARRTILETRLDRWPSFTVKLAPLLVASERTMSGSPILSLSLLLCELLGRPLPAGATGPGATTRLKAPLIGGLGEAGNEILRRGLSRTRSGKESPWTGRDFCTELARAIDL